MLHLSSQDCRTENSLAYHLEEASLVVVVVVVVMMTTTMIHHHRIVLAEATTARNSARQRTGQPHLRIQLIKHNHHPSNRHKDNEGGALDFVLDFGRVLQPVLQQARRQVISLLIEGLSKNRVRLEVGIMLVMTGSVMAVAMVGVRARRDQEVPAARRRVLDLVIRRIDTRALDLVARVGGSEIGIDRDRGL